MEKIHFISGLPRSGSTMLSAILAQNPRFYANMSGPVASLVGNLLEGMSQKNEFSVYLNDAQRKRIINATIQAYYEDQPGKTVFDTHRSWCARIGVIENLFPESKIIACVRNVSWIIDSIEQLAQKNAFQPSSMFNYQSGGTVYSRADAVAGGDGLVGYAFNALKQAYYSSLSPGRLMILQYESLVANPHQCIEEIYRFVDEPFFEHDFNNIKFDGTEFDKRIGAPGLHDVHPTVSLQPRPTILPPDLFSRFQNDSFWLNPALIRPDVKIV